MKYILLVYLFNPYGEFEMKDIIETQSQIECENTAAAYAKTVLNTNNSINMFCLTEEEYDKDNVEN